MVGEGHETPRVKICGLTNLEDAQVAMEAGADLLGFIFYEKSPRYVDPRTVASIVGALKSAPLSTLHSPPLFVGVFVNPALEQVTQMLNQCNLDLAQLHGEEDPQLLALLAKRAFKALRPRWSLRRKLTHPAMPALGRPADQTCWWTPTTRTTAAPARPATGPWPLTWPASIACCWPAA